MARFNPKVEEYCEKWLEMQASSISPSTLKGYTLAVRKYIEEPLGDLYMTEVTADDLRLAMVPVSKMSVSVYDKVNMLLKSIFYSAEYSKIITDKVFPPLFAPHLRVIMKKPSSCSACAPMPQEKGMKKAEG